MRTLFARVERLMGVDVGYGPVARYTPYLSGSYRVAAGLSPLGTDFGNGRADQALFQIDEDWGQYRGDKQRARREKPGKYVLTTDLSPTVAVAVFERTVQHLTSEYPHAFSLRDAAVCTVV